MFTNSIFDIQSLASGGLITTYACSSRCRHCLYAAGPEREHTFMDAETTRRACSRIKSLRCNTIHIGGGEPMLDVESLTTVLEIAMIEGLRVEYVETNCAWFRDMHSACKLLQELKCSGLSTLLLSISPFHNAYVPLDRVTGVMRACEESGIAVFPWTLDFYQELAQLDTSLPHSLEALIQHFGPEYLRSVAQRYWIHFTGRAVRTFEPLFEKNDARTIVAENPYGCRELCDTSHFHIDLYGNYVPGLCAGLALDIDDLAADIDRSRYALLDMLCSGGINALFETAVARYGFTPRAGYISKCDLCQHIRSFLVSEGLYSRELQPTEFYSSLAVD